MRLNQIFPLIALVFSFLMSGEGAAAQFKIATVVPEGSQWMLDLKAGGKQITERTDGRVTFKFYGGGVMGNDKKVLRKIRIGQLQGGVFASTGLAERYRDIVLYGLPMVFRSQAEVDYVREKMDPTLQAGLEDAGFVSFGFAGGGFAMLMGNEPITQIDQLRGRKVWVPEGDRVSYQAMQDMELAPTVLPITDVLTALQTGLLEFFATPPVGAVVLQWYTKVRYVTEYPFAYSVGVMAIDKKPFAKLSEGDQEIVREVFSAIYANIEQTNRTDNDKAEDALRANGLEFVRLDDDLSEVERKVAASSRSMAGEGVVSLELLDEMLGHLETYRSAGGGAGAPASAAE